MSPASTFWIPVIDAHVTLRSRWLSRYYVAFWHVPCIGFCQGLGREKAWESKEVTDKTEQQMTAESAASEKITHGSEAKYGVVLFAYAVRHFASGVVWSVKSRCRSKAPFKTNFGIAISVVVTVNSSFHWLENVNNSHRMKASESRRWSQSSHGLWFFSLIWHQILLLWRYPRCEEVRWP